MLRWADSCTGWRLPATRGHISLPPPLQASAPLPMVCRAQQLPTLGSARTRTGARVLNSEGAGGSLPFHTSSTSEAAVGA